MTMRQWLSPLHFRKEGVEGVDAMVEDLIMHQRNSKVNVLVVEKRGITKIIAPIL